MSTDQVTAAYDAYRAAPDAADHFWRALHKYVRQLVRAARVQDADDVTQTITVAVWRALPGYRGRAKFGTWVHRLVKNRLLNAKRDYGRVSQHLDPREAHPDEGVSPASERSPARDYSSLPEEVRAIAVMLAAGHTIAEVASTRGCSEKTIRRMVERHAPE